jgi:hypothetical protein
MRCPVNAYEISIIHIYYNADRRFKLYCCILLKINLSKKAALWSRYGWKLVEWSLQYLHRRNIEELLYDVIEIVG